MSTKNSNDTVENRTRDVPTSSAVSKPTAPPHAPIITVWLVQNMNNVRSSISNLGKDFDVISSLVVGIIILKSSSFVLTLILHRKKPPQGTQA
jgi:hypothetical protein